MLSCVHLLPNNADKITFAGLLMDRLQQLHTQEQQSAALAAAAALAATAAAESASSQMPEAPAAPLWHQAANAPSSEEADQGLRSHLQAFEAGSSGEAVPWSQVRYGL